MFRFNSFSRKGKKKLALKSRKEYKKKKQTKTTKNTEIRGPKTHLGLFLEKLLE